MQTIDGRLVVLAGKSRSGKTAYTAQAVAGSRRVIAWDPHDQWGRLRGWQRITSASMLHQAIQTFGPARLAYVPQAGTDLKIEFEKFCKIALQFAKIFGPCDVIAEELATVSTSAKAPQAWGDLLRFALKLGSNVYAISQRWAEADKTALGNPSEVVCFQMMPMDVDYMAKRTGIAPGELAALRKLETATLVTCPYVQMDLDSGRIERAKLVFRKKMK